MKITTWNINSVRLRLPMVLEVLKTLQTDVLCLQETKTQDEFFPHEALADAGWGHIAFRGEKSYNGVAIISRLPIETQHHKLWAGKDDCRHICARINGVDIHDFYIPAGGDIADRNENPKFGHKIDFVDEMRDWFAANLPRSSVLVGDLNIAPLAEDVWSTRQLRKVVSHTDIEREKLTFAIHDGGWVDAVRNFYGPDEVLYSWWSYRARDWQASNRGRRLDHIWVSADLKDKVRHVDIMAEARGFEKPSDHVPMTIELAD